MITVIDNYIYLNTKNTGYIMRILPDGILNHCYYGARLPVENMDYLNLFIQHEITVNLHTDDLLTTPDALPQECPGFGRGDFGRPAIAISNDNGRAVNELKYSSHRIVDGKPIIKGLPQTDAYVEELQTLEITLEDVVTGAEIIHSYTPFYEEDVIARHTTVRNKTKEKLSILSVASATLDFEYAEYDMVSLGGAWEREREIERHPIHHGENTIASRYGLSGHHLNPFAALAKKDTCEDYGEVYGFALVYSGNFKISAEKGQYNRTRLWMGINPELFSWELQVGEEFETPEALLTYSENGFTTMSHNFHEVCRNHLGVCADKSKKHPIVLNLWEALHTDISEEKLEQVIDDSKELGIETLVIDDGWFGCRNDDKTSLGDWLVNKEKFPNGLTPIIEKCKENGMGLGLWFEPEMVSRESDFYKAHPDWCIHIPGIEAKEIRNQLVLDLSRSEVVDAIVKRITEVIRQYQISYVKWDMNRSITDNGTSWLPAHRQNEQAHRHMLGVYDLMNRVTKEFPNVFFEGCASGGGRNDFGTLYYMPQVWTSDNTDAYERMKIQYGTSMVYPPETISAHVSACPNISTRRSTPFKTRGDVAQLFSFGYELNPALLTDDEREQVIEQTKKHKEIEQYYAEGLFYRLRSPYESNTCAWQFVSKEQNHSIVFFANLLVQPNYCGEYLQLKGLDDNKKYLVNPLGITASGKTLRCAGVPITKQPSDFSSILFELEEIN